ncbi:MAG: glucose 1-dehydrogenase [Sphingomonadaceae bacterium]|nr:glucose 1-dehydrogenase [Sphingomonadaceae bacterium]
MLDLDGKTIIVTGATKGIGLGIVWELVERGAQVVVSSRNADDCRAVAEELNTRTGRNCAIGLDADIESLDVGDRLLAACLSAFGRIDGLVCNAAVMPFHGPSDQTPPEKFAQLLHGNVHATFRLCQTVSVPLRAQKQGSIVIIGSAAGLIAEPLLMAYGASKLAQIHVAKCLATELAPYGVRVNCVPPGLIRSEQSRPVWTDPEMLKQMLGTIAIKRIGEPRDVAAVVAFLLSDSSSYVTGTVIPVDGGMTSLPASAGLADALDSAFS